MNALLNMTTTTGAEEIPGAGDNSQSVMDKLRADLRKYGSAEALGTASRPTAARRLVDAAFDGLAKEGDAETLYGEYQRGMVAVGKKNPLTANDTSEKIQISKFRQFIKVGMLPGIDARDLMQRASDRIAAMKMAEVKVLAPFDALLNVAREQMKQTEDLLTDEQIDAAICKPEAKTKETLDKLIAAYKVAHKLADETKMEEVAAARDAYATAITEAGGDVPPMTKDEKARAEFMKQAAAFGIKI